jgi:hypothetical protein
MGVLGVQFLFRVAALALFALGSTFGEVALLGVAGGASRTQVLPGTSLPADATFRFNGTGVADLLLAHAPAEGVDDELLASAAAATRLDGVAATLALDRLHAVLAGGLLTLPAEADKPLTYHRGTARLELRWLQGDGGVWEVGHSAASGAATAVRALALALTAATATGQGGPGGEGSTYTLTVHGHVNATDVLLPGSPSLHRALEALRPAEQAAEEGGSTQAAAPAAAPASAHSLQATLGALASALATQRRTAQANHTALQDAVAALQVGLGALDTTAAANHSALVSDVQAAAAAVAEQLQQANASHVEVCHRSISSPLSQQQGL